MMKQKKIPRMSHVILLNLKRVPSPGSGKMMPECAKSLSADAAVRLQHGCTNACPAPCIAESSCVYRWEDMAAVSCAVQNMQLMATSLGVACEPLRQCICVCTRSIPH